MGPINYQLIGTWDRLIAALCIDMYNNTIYLLLYITTGQLSKVICRILFVLAHVHIAYTHTCGRYGLQYMLDADEFATQDLNQQGM